MVVRTQQDEVRVIVHLSRLHASIRGSPHLSTDDVSLLADHDGEVSACLVLGKSMLAYCAAAHRSSPEQLSVSRGHWHARVTTLSCYTIITCLGTPRAPTHAALPRRPPGCVQEESGSARARGCC